MVDVPHASLTTDELHEAKLITGTSAPGTPTFTGQSYVRTDEGREAIAIGLAGTFKIVSGLPRFGTANPLGSITPDYKGQLFYDATNIKTYIANGLTNSAWGLIGGFTNQNANLFFAGPSSGAAAAPTFRAIATTDLPASTAFLNAIQSWNKAQQASVTTLTDGSTIALDASLSNLYQVTLAGNRTLANPTNLAIGSNFEIRIAQDATGSRTLAYGTAYKFSGGVVPVLSTSANAIDLLSCRSYDGTTLQCDLGKGYA